MLFVFKTQVRKQIFITSNSGQLLLYIAHFTNRRDVIIHSPIRP